MPGRDFTEKWAPVVRQATLRTLLALVAANDWHVQQMDIKAAFLNGTLEEELYVRQPPDLSVVARRSCAGW